MVHYNLDAMDYDVMDIDVSEPVCFEEVNCQCLECYDTGLPNCVDLVENNGTETLECCGAVEYQCCDMSDDGTCTESVLQETCHAQEGNCPTIVVNYSYHFLDNWYDRQKTTTCPQNDINCRNLVYSQWQNSDYHMYMCMWPFEDDPKITLDSDFACRSEGETAGYGILSATGFLIFFGLISAVWITMIKDLCIWLCGLPGRLWNGLVALGKACTCTCKCPCHKGRSLCSACPNRPRQDQPDPDECSICMNPINDGRPIGIIPCTHQFHRDCIQGWVDGGNNTCPMCRAVFAPGDIANDQA